ncbi:hypothetical protein AYI70_g4487 [Smittium culicis]|uniref:Uncharacterized protein n=1 Tax=Smittium culicis TaxID=133412 RepID=A0A1R1XYR5_9FUNG|nr:hypothetical protein AYI70_g4487 [Smittium culicis]
MSAVCYASYGQLSDDLSGGDRGEIRKVDEAKVLVNNGKEQYGQDEMTWLDMDKAYEVDGVGSDVRVNGTSDNIEIEEDYGEVGAGGEEGAGGVVAGDRAIDRLDARNIQECGEVPRVRGEQLTFLQRMCGESRGEQYG